MLVNEAFDSVVFIDSARRRAPAIFYLKFGFKERGRVVYRGDPLVYYEFPL